jgi:protocatechuate 3,4-dioxygenase beta subunit
MDHDGGLHQDLALIAVIRRRARRRLLSALLGGGTLTLLGSGAARAACTLPARETAGPFPANGSNAAHGATSNVLAQSGIVRSDIRASFGGPRAVAAGQPLTLAMKLQDARAGCAPLRGYVVYLWQSDREGNYSLYAPALRNENYLRGAQVCDADGEVRFTTIFPGCYEGRWPHVHFEVYPDVASATGYAKRVLTSQLALPAEVCKAVYSTADGYAASATNLSRMSLARDGIFANNTAAQMAAMTPKFTGDGRSGYSATTTLGIDA